ncbi:MAG: STAS/SEC14 domain-containing protein [Chloroflexi bacterium]|nr:STAS/SEC14 domain-containing protein [Chloroflexota bacterium]
MSDHFQYQNVDDYIHEFIFEDAKKEAVDDFYDMFQQLVALHNAAQPYLMMLDLRKSGHFPIGHARQRQRAAFSQAEKFPMGRIALVVERPGVVDRVVSTMVRALHLPVRVEFFAEREVALGWLKDALDE